MDLLTKVKALGADDYVSPTIPFVPPNVATPTPTAIVSGPSISLESNFLTIKKGDVASIKVVIFTNSQEIKSFTFRITFDPALFQVVDADSSKEGVQIPYSNTYFKQTENDVDNERGSIDFTAEASGSAPITDRVMSEIQVQGIAMGTGQFTVVKSASGLIDTNGDDILTTTTNLTLSVGNMTVTTTPTLTVSPETSNGATVSPTVLPSTITPTGFNDTVGGVTSMLLGTLLVISGIYLYKKKHNYDLQR